MRGSRLLCLVFGLSLLASSPALAQNPAESGDEPAAGAVGDAAGAAEAAAEEVGGDAAEAVDATEEAADAAEEAADAAEEAADAAEEAADEVPPARTFADYAADNPAPPAGGTSGDAPSSGTDWRRITEAELLEPSQTYPWIEWHGYFRFRADSFWNLDLDTNGTSPILPPIEAMIAPGAETDLDGLTAGADDLTNIEAEHIGGANIRLRLHPIFQITEKTRIHLELNVLDNIVLGSTPDGYNEFNPTALRTDLPVIGFTGGQEPPSLLNAGRDSISVTQAYGEVNTFFGTIRLGRMASQWGLGILANGGGSYSTLREPRTSYRGLSMSGHGCMDCDNGDYVDRAMFVTNMFDTYLALAWDYNYAGPTDLDLGDYFGQPRDLGQYDDVRSIVVALFQRPLRNEEIAERNRTLKELRQPTFDWGAYYVYRRQLISAEGFNAEELGTQSEGLRDSDYLNFVNRDARAHIPDLWFRFLSEPAFRTRIRLEGEFVGIFGTIGNADPNSPSDDKERDIQQFGGALEFEYVRAALATGLNTGFATGRTFDDPNSDAQGGFGVNDSWTVRDDEPTITNFKFDRNYFVDAIMFREIIGAITNTVYVNPFVQYDLFSKQDDNLGVRLDLITAFAMQSDSTPSGEGYYGLETDLTLYYREPRYGADVMAGVYLPGSAFDAVEGQDRINGVALQLGRQVEYQRSFDAKPAWTLQGRFFWAF